MLKAIFIDYTGTTVMEGGPEMQETVMRVCKNSTLSTPKELMKIWWGLIRTYEVQSYKETYLTEDDILDKAFEKLEEEFSLRENREELKELVRGFWSNAPVFPDVKEFFDTCPLPIYIITNNGTQYVGKAMEKHDLHPAGIICADMVQAYKPHRELFEKALEVSGCKPEEVMHIGDSYDSDVLGARAAGIKPVLVLRDATEERPEDCMVVNSLLEIKDF